MKHFLPLKIFLSHNLVGYPPTQSPPQFILYAVCAGWFGGVVAIRNICRGLRKSWWAENFGKTFSSENSSEFCTHRPTRARLPDWDIFYHFLSTCFIIHHFSHQFTQLLLFLIQNTTPESAGGVSCTGYVCMLHRTWAIIFHVSCSNMRTLGGLGWVFWLTEQLWRFRGSVN